MKKLYILLVAILVTTFSFGQEMMINGDLESWDDSTTPTSWTKAETLTQETTEFHGGANAAKRNGGSGTKDLAQAVTAVAGDSYTISFWYKVTAGDGTDARIWSNWEAAGTNLTDNEAELKGPNNAYLPNNGGVWTEYSVTLVAPATADKLEFEVRSYSGSTVFWDDLSVMHNTVVPVTLSITSPAGGSVEPTGNVTVNYVIGGFNVATAGMGDGHFHWQLDGGASTPVYTNTGTLDLTGLAAGSHTLFMDLRDDAHASLSPAVESTVTFTVQTYTQVATIADLRAGTINDYYELTGEALINYAQSFRNQKYIQDSSAGILIDDTSGNITAGVRGDGLSGIKGRLREYQGMMQFSPSLDATLTSPSSITITPEVVTLADLAAMSENYEAELIKVEGVMLAGTGNFENGTIYPMTQGADTFDFRTNFHDIDYTPGSPIPTVAKDIVGLVAQNSVGYTFVARDLADFQDVAAVGENNIAGFAMYPNPVNNGVLTITTLQNAEKSIQIFNILGKQVLAKTITGKTINVANLNAGIYLIKVTEASNFTTRKLIIK